MMTQKPYSAMSKVFCHEDFQKLVYAQHCEHNGQILGRNIMYHQRARHNRQYFGEYLQFSVRYQQLFVRNQQSWKYQQLSVRNQQRII